jgi:hypothetical protein
MWTLLNQTYATHNGQNAWGNLAANNTGWRKIAPNSPDGVTNVFLMLVAARASSKQVHVVQNASNQITGAYF